MVHHSCLNAALNFTMPDAERRVQRKSVKFDKKPNSLIFVALDANGTT